MTKSKSSSIKRRSPKRQKSKCKAGKVRDQVTKRCRMPKKSKRKYSKSKPKRSKPKKSKRKYSKSKPKRSKPKKSKRKSYGRRKTAAFTPNNHPSTRFMTGWSTFDDIDGPQLHNMGWRSVLDNNTGRLYFFNIENPNATTWDDPRTLVPGPGAQRIQQVAQQFANSYQPGAFRPTPEQQAAAAEFRANAERNAQPTTFAEFAYYTPNTATDMDETGDDTEVDTDSEDEDNEEQTG
jgi:hypothetical protein